MALSAFADIRKGAEATGEARARQRLTADPDEPATPAYDTETPPPVIVVPDDRPAAIGDRDGWRRADYADDPWQATVAAWRERGWRT